ncbi:MAG: hypothetical protein E6002_08700 [Veillonella sp.]|nr:hypothetical protein [Veillonella sp.]
MDSTLLLKSFDHVFFENLAYDDHEFEADDAEDVDDDDEGTPVFVVWLGS